MKIKLVILLLVCIACNSNKKKDTNIPVVDAIKIDTSNTIVTSGLDENRKATLATIDSVSINEIKRYIDDELPTIFDYYKQELVEEHSAWSDKLFGRCCSNADLTFTENLFYKINSNVKNEKYPITNISDTDYSTAYVFKPNTKVKINIQLDPDKSFLSGKYSNKKLLNTNEVIMNPIKLSLINGYVKSKALFYENTRVKEVKVYVNHKYIETVVLMDTPLVQEFKVNAIFKTNDIITLEPVSVYKGSKYDDVCISEIQTNLGKTALPGLNKKYNLMELLNKE
ncbi:hypothetical protein IWQ47_001566 [Aquimarina sp. EL_43]|uniref:NADase-type glycan-binding domain-containing protein n=1 Tax=unclassified Aquimarina TaxID=2627091 RepID=UPI0018CA9537|nr:MULTISPECIES: hypothetical protein [unclassified Aquimarina]MBG6130351.1 hypothetical protein [Aquimarina sp. EL_35]MBG6149131.1 hypothetical protein [Aquimarina sp. EL_32]MBG6168495.1 hypothetical protein [Aquimarina sp. EL_43]